MTKSAENAEIRCQANVLQRFLANAFVALAVPPADAETVAGLMVEADLNGLDTHGTFRLPQYMRRLRDGGTNPKPDVRLVRDMGAIAVIDGDNGLGHLAMLRAAGIAMDKADQFGIGWVGVRNGNHAGPATLYVSKPVQRDQIGLCAAVGNANHVAPWGGMDLLLGTNPIAIAVPAGSDPPFILDMATTIAAAGKIKTLAQRGEPMPEGWMVDRDGRPMTDPNRHKEGLLLPIGGPKGYGLAMAVGLLAGTLNGAAFGRDVVDFSSDTTSPTNTGQFVAAISIEAFGDAALFKSTVETIFQEIRSSTPLPGGDPIRIPGENRRTIVNDRREQGIPLHPNLLAALNSVADELQIEPLAP